MAQTIAKTYIYGGNVIVLLSIDIKAIIADIKAKQVA